MVDAGHDIEIIHMMGRKTKDFLRKVDEVCPELVEPSWYPVQSKVATMPTIFMSKFGGPTPWMADAHQRPLCKNGHPMSFLCQINIATLPEALKTRINLWDGLFQLFLCVKEGIKGCDPDENCFNEVRIIPQSDLKNDSLMFLSAVACKDLDLTGLPVQVQEYVGDLWNTTKKRGRRRKDAPKVFNEHLVGSWNKSDMLEIPTFNELHQNTTALAKLGLTPAEMIAMRNSYLGGVRYRDVDKGVPNIRGPCGEACGIKIGGWVEWSSSCRYLQVESCKYPRCPSCPGSPQMDLCFLTLNIGLNGETGFVTLCSKCQKPALFF